MTTFVNLTSEKGQACEDVLRIIYPRRVSFTHLQVTDAGFFIKRLGYEKVLQIAGWAARKITLKEGRYEAWVRTCRKAMAESKRESEEKKKAAQA